MHTSRHIILIDSYSLIFRAFYATDPARFSSPDGMPTNAIFGYTRMLLNLFRDRNPDLIVAVFDEGIPKIRLEQIPEYKANRDETPDDLKVQIPWVKKVIEAFGIPIVSSPGFEADDVIGTYSTLASVQGDRVEVITGDRDLFQLADDNVTICYTRKGLSDMPEMTPKKIEEEYGVSPALYPLLAAIRGDASDNIKGVPLIGPKIAAQYINSFGDLDGIRANLDTLTGKRGENMRAHIDDIERGLAVTTIIRDVPITQTIDDLKMGEVSPDDVNTVFDALAFRTLKTDATTIFGLDGEQTNPEVEAPPILTMDPQICAPGDIARYLEALTPSDSVSLYGRIAGVLPDLRVDVIGIAIGGHNPVAIAVSQLNDEDRISIQQVFSHPHLITHNHKTVCHTFRAMGWAVPDFPWVDTLICGHTLRPDDKPDEKTVPGLAHQWLDLELEKEVPGQIVGEAQLNLDDAIEEDEIRCAGVYAAVLAGLAPLMRADIDAQALNNVLDELEYPLIAPLVRMEQTGITVDRDVLNALSVSLNTQVEAAKTTAHDIVGEPINLDSPKALSELLFDRLGLPKTKKTARGYSTNAGALEKLIDAHPIIPAILEYRAVAKLRSTYVDPLPLAIQSDGRIHSEFDQTTAATGRLASRNPNLQNIPIRSEVGRMIRRAFIPGKGYDHILVADYSQLELRLIAHLSGDEGLISAFRAGHDIHAATAATVFSIPIDTVSNAQRSKIKGMVYGLAYGLSAWGLAGQLNIPQTEAKELQDAFFEAFPKVKVFLRQGVDEARETGWTETMCGRRRYLPDLSSNNRMARENAERMALNAPIQGSAADLMKLAMIKAYALLDTAQLDAQILLQVHDELVVEVTDAHLTPMRELLVEAMTTVMTLDVPLTVDTAHGPNWADAEKH
ncbi:DNA polymerase I [Stomatohabitans albus]|uniref:DNA polymerase I n=1 Tax=Stomatohabitans albus TaxID=3110766 RepID=UPI00300D0C02